MRIATGLAKRALRALSHVSIRLLSALEGQGPLKKTMTGEARAAGAAKAALVITTFAERFESHALPTLRALHAAGVEREIFLVINGDQRGRYEATTRKQFLAQAVELGQINPITLGTGRGMAEMWNTGARLADSEKLIFLNEDLLISQEFALSAIVRLEDELEKNHLVILNDSFGHFGLTMSALMEVGWFDERFLGFGEEDGDFVWRFLEVYPEGISRISHPGLSNAFSTIGYESIESADRTKYSEFNYQMLRCKYEFLEGPAEGSFGQSAKLVSPGAQRYPDELFRREFKGEKGLLRGDSLRAEIIKVSSLD
jgi:hypothetical protein